MTHQSPSPLCEVDKSSRADLPRSAGGGYERARLRASGRENETVRLQLRWAGGVYEQETVSNLYDKQRCLNTY